MSPDDSATTSTERSRMVDRQLRRRGIEDERVLAAMEEVPRELFLPEDMRRRAYRDGALRIGEGQTMSQPWIVACMAQLLELEGHETVLEVGTGSGYAAAVLCRLCRQVVTIERFESLASRAREVLAELGYDNVEVRVGDGAKGARPSALRRHFGHRHRPRRSTPGAPRSARSRRRARVPGRPRRARAAHALSRRRGGGDRPGALRAARRGRAVISTAVSKLARGR